MAGRWSGSYFVFLFLAIFISTPCTLAMDLRVRVVLMLSAHTSIVSPFLVFYLCCYAASHSIFLFRVFAYVTSFSPHIFV